MATAYFTRLLREAERKLMEEAQSRPTDLVDLYRRVIKVEESGLKRKHQAGMGGREFCRERSELISAVLKHVWNKSISQVKLAHGEGVGLEIALVAIGGFGRGTLNPYSDVDLLFVYTTGRQTEYRVVKDVVEQVLYMLWDVGFKVGHAVRTLEEVTDQANSDLQTKTSLLDARYLCGEKELWLEFERSFERLCIEGRETEYVEWRVADQVERHKKYGGTVCVQEPNVKNGCGGLRDYHNLLWVARVKRGFRSSAELLEAKLLHPREKKQIDEAFDFLLRLRNQMHFTQAGANDQLTLRLQGRVANAFHYPDPTILRRTEALMREYYWHAQDLFLITNSLAKRMSGLGGGSKPRWSFLPSGTSSAKKVEDFILQDGEFEIEDPNSLSGDTVLILRVFVLAQQHHAAIGPQLAMRLRRRAHLVTRKFIYRTEVQVMLRTILSRKGCVARILRSMHEVGLLGRFFPEFEPLTCLVQHEFFHRYTADEHTLVCLEMLDRVFDSSSPPHNKYTPLLHQLEHPDILYLAMLLHDTGKAANSKHHSDESAANAVRVARRMRLSMEELSKLVFLVDHHLTMSETARRKNLEDEETVLEFARVVQTPERLDMLMLFTFADNEGTSGSHSWSDWKELLMWQLYRRTSSALTGKHEFTIVVQRSMEELCEKITANLAKEIPSDEVKSHFSNLPQRYFVNTSEQFVQRHIELAHDFFRRQMMSGDSPLKPVIDWRDNPQQGHSEVTVVTWDREGVFAKICGAFACVGLTILYADIYTRNDNIVIDSFRVSSIYHGGVMDERDKKKFNTMLDRAMTDSGFDFNDTLNKHRDSNASLEEGEFPTRITFDQRASSEYTLLDIQTPDRPGLLYHVSGALARSGVDIAYARITTEKGAALDTFYITDQLGNKVASEEWQENIAKVIRTALEV